MFYKSVFVCVCLNCIISIVTFNLEPKHAQIFTNNQPSSYFGYSLLLQSALREYPARLIVGAPRANSSFTTLHSSIIEPGALYSCSVHSQNCQQFLFDSNANTNSRRPNGMTFHHRKDYGWLGSVVDGQDFTTGLIVACAPRWINQIYKEVYYLQNGLCYLLRDTTNIERKAEELIPLLDQARQGFKANNDNVYYYALAEAGMSLHLTKNYSEILIGAPGVLQWKGLIVKYYDYRYENVENLDQKSLNFDDMYAPNPYYINKLEDFSYFGYSVSSGKFIAYSNQLWYVGGAPRGRNLFGQVLVYEYVKDRNELKVHFEMSGMQQGEYFGAAIAVGDINQDGVDDILVGSPMYEINKKYDAGCIYLFMNDGKGSFSRKLIHGPEIQLIRYGSAVSVIGDIDLDGFLDVAVGAPNYNGGKGAIFIYSGDKNGINSDYSQLILASDISPVLQGFGMSFSKGIDIDNNHYKDIAVGAYKSGQAVIIKSKPVVRISATLQTDDKQISINTTAFSINACIEYSGVHVPKTLNIKLILNADPFHRRIFFTRNSGTLLEIVKPIFSSTSNCAKLDITIANSKSDFSQPISIQMVHDIIVDRNNESFCADCPVTAPHSSNMTSLNIPYDTGCLSTICQPDLKLGAKFLYNRPYVIIGSIDSIDVEITVKNLGEPAFISKLYVELPQSSSFVKIPDICQQANQILICSMGNPIFANGMKYLRIQIDISSLKLMDNFILKMNVTSAGTEINQSDNLLLLNLPLKTQVDISLLGISEPEQFVFVDENKLLKQNNYMFTHQYTIYNLGPSILDDLELVFLIPYKLGKSGREFINIFEPDISSEDNSVECTTFFNNFYIENVDDEETDSENVNSQLRTKRSNYIDGIAVAEAEEIKLSKTSAVYSKIQKIMSSTNEIPDDFPINRTFSLSCTTPKIDIECMEIRCKSGLLYTKIKNQINFNFRLIANLKILDEIRDEKDIVVITSSVQPVSKHFKTNMTYTHSILQGSLKQESALKWIVTGCILGIIILCLIIFALYKLGFFKRKDHERLMNEKEKIDELIEDTDSVLHL